MQAFEVIDANPEKLNVSTKMIWQILRGKSQSKMNLTDETLAVYLPPAKDTSL